MKTINNEGQLNNYASEPPVYYAQYPSPEQQQRYLLQGGIFILAITGLILFSIGIS